ncbi:hypothetical protein [Arsenicicoccus dermatophilus]|uniref:hypothetical protein n=1 Tax=Arsenicicoccus dermatophilus TaxID=1076331 RepID=UPI001F4C8FED|nr:hypothetical protein [Arsenicicoccus dermatophilus]MCH8614469.1 hypothetical protein [Arsenicicoccus dermatophilus]
MSLLVLGVHWTLLMPSFASVTPTSELAHLVTAPVLVAQDDHEGVGDRVTDRLLAVVVGVDDARRGLVELQQRGQPASGARRAVYEPGLTADVLGRGPWSWPS